ncbi:MAG: metal-dependent transcriptional regulator [Chloroflexi bacterium]|nr:metal-dependent transcriptional regulator [Chloroflexota bacterium]
MQDQPAPSPSSLRRSPAAGEYLVRIYIKLRERKRIVGARLAESMGVSPPAVTQALRRMTRDGLLDQESDVGVRLTEKGRALAEGTLRRHYLLERMLVDQLGYSWATVDEEAHRMEHSLSPQLEEFLYERLGRPATCPHGNPFPGSPAEAALIQSRTLASASRGEKVTMLRVTEDGEEQPVLMHRLLECGFLPGVRGTVVTTNKNAGTMRLRAPKGTVELPMALAEYVRVSEPLA